jgi:phage repressor protein C with HTH and peptisase S24 domain
MADEFGIRPEWLKHELDRSGRSQSALARFMGFSSAAIVNRMVQGKRDISAREADQIRAYLKGTARGEMLDLEFEHMGVTPDRPPADAARSYVSVEVLPTYAGMGGGGTGDGDRQTALVERRLVEDELRARPSDLLLVNVRGNSMEPLFFHGDQLLIDKRDTSPTQPGPFALLWPDGYVVKNVTWVEKRTRLRVSSSNPDFGPEDFEPDEITILGRPIWLGRRL